MGDLGSLGPWVLMGVVTVCLAWLVSGLPARDRSRWLNNALRAWAKQKIAGPVGEVQSTDSKGSDGVHWRQHEDRLERLPAWIDEELAAERSKKGDDRGLALIVRPEDQYLILHLTRRLSCNGKLDGRIEVWLQRADAPTRCTHFVQRGHDDLAHCDLYTGPSGRNGKAPAEPRWMVRNHRT